MKDDLKVVQKHLDTASAATKIADVQKGAFHAVNAIGTALSKYKGSTAKANASFKKLVGRLKVIETLAKQKAIAEVNPQLTAEVKKLHQDILKLSRGEKIA